MGNQVLSNGSRSNFWGYVAGIVTGISYGMNPLFGKPLLQSGVSVDTMLFFRYFLSVVILGAWLLFRGHSLKVSLKQLDRLVILGLLFGTSSITLFNAYKYIPSGLATTLIYLYPVLVALLMTLFRVYPSWQVWLSIIMTFAGVMILCKPSGDYSMQWQGIVLAGASALAYAIYLVVVNRSTTIRTLDSLVLTFYVLVTGSLIFLVHQMVTGTGLMDNVHGTMVWLNMVGLAVFPTIISLVTLAISIRLIGATKTSVLGVFEPLTAITIGICLFGERVTTNIVIGIILSVSAIIFMVLSSAYSKK